MSSKAGRAAFVAALAAPAVLSKAAQAAKFYTVEVREKNEDGTAGEWKKSGSTFLISDKPDHELKKGSARARALQAASRWAGEVRLVIPTGYSPGGISRPAPRADVFFLFRCHCPGRFPD